MVDVGEGVGQQWPSWVWFGKLPWNLRYMSVLQESLSYSFIDWRRTERTLILIPGIPHSASWKHAPCKNTSKDFAELAEQFCGTIMNYCCIHTGANDIKERLGL